MPLKLEVVPEPQRKAGGGLLLISGLEAPPPAAVVLTLQENIAGEFLTEQGRWDSQTAPISLPVARQEFDHIIVALPAPIVDALAVLPPNCRLRATIGPQKGTVLISRSLLSSLASAPDEGRTTDEPSSPPQPDSTPVAEPEEAPAPLRLDTPFGEERPTPRRTARSGIAVTALVLLLLAVLGGWMLLNRPESEPQQTTPPSPRAASPDSAISDRDALNRYLLGNPSAEAAKSLGDRLMADGKGDLAMLTWQFAARNGDTAAMIALAGLYDPDTWSAKTSPMPQPDPETAAYWYESAAQAGDPTAQRQLGKILRTLYPSGRQHDKGIEWLQKAAKAGDAAAQRLLQDPKP